MAIFRPGPLVSAVSGDIGGINFVSSSHGHYIRRKATVCNRDTERQLYRRTAINFYATVWRAMNATQRSAWVTAAWYLLWPNRLGIHRRITPWQSFLKWNLPLYPGGTTVPSTFGGIIKSLAPTSFTVALPVNGIWEGTLAPTAGSPVKTVLIECSRPHRNTVAPFYRNWFSLPESSVAAEDFTIYNTADADPRLSTADVGEVLAFRMRWLRRTSEVEAFPSTPIIATGTIVP